MSYNGSGTFSINTAGQPVVTGSTITSTAFNALTADLANGLSTALCKDGQSTPTANISLGGFKITNLAVGTLGTDAARLSQVQSGSATSITASGTDTYIGTMIPALSAYAAGNLFSFVVPNTNTTSCTLNIDGLGAKAITRDGSTALVAGDLVANSEVVVVYDGTRFQVLNSNSKTNFNVSNNLGVSSTASLLASFNSTNASAGYVSFQSSSTNYGYLGSGASLSTANATDLTVRSQNNLTFATGGGSERARINSSGYFKASNTGSYYDVNNTYHELRTNSTTNYTVYIQSVASTTGNFGVAIQYTNRAPNDTNNEFLLCSDSAATRMYVRSNGGISNYQANDTNLSDRREKTDLAPAKRYLDVVCAIPVQTFKYIDQTDDEPTLGVVAQDVQAVAPELVSESNWGTADEPKLRLSVYQTDLQYALMKAIQDLAADNQQLRDRIEALESAKQ